MEDKLSKIKQDFRDRFEEFKESGIFEEESHSPNMDGKGVKSSSEDTIIEPFTGISMGQNGSKVIIKRPLS